MRESRFTLPCIDNNGNDITDIHERLGVELTKTFGGATILHGEGLYLARDGNIQQEPIATFVVAFDPSLDANRQFHRIVSQYGRLAGQEAIYFTDPDGTTYSRSVLTEAA